MTRGQALVIGAVVAIASIVASAWAYPQLPGTVPTHWDVAGNVDGYSSRFIGVALLPAIIILAWLLMLILPAISPKGFQLERSAAAFYESVLAIIVVLAITSIPLLRAEFTGRRPSTGLLMLPVGALLVILGNLMGKLRKNFFIGIRTPWTLASDEVWLKTNRLGGRLMVVCGLIVIILSFSAQAAVVAILSSVFCIITVTMVYSYVLYRRIEGTDNGQEST